MYMSSNIYDDMHALSSHQLLASAQHNVVFVV